MEFCTNVLMVNLLFWLLFEKLNKCLFRTINRMIQLNPGDGLGVSSHVLGMEMNRFFAVNPDMSYRPKRKRLLRNLPNIYSLHNYPSPAKC